MIWFKSLGVGLLAVIAAMPIMFVGLRLILKFRFGVSNVGIDVVALLTRNLTIQLLLVASFVIGFAWEYRRMGAR